MLVPVTTKTLKRNDPLDDVVLAALAGDKAAWERLVKELDQRLIAYLSARGSPEDSRDAVQNAWSKAWQKTKTFDPGDSPAANFRGFLFRIAINQLISTQRRKRGQSLDDEFDAEANIRSGDDNLILQEELAIMKQCIEVLPEDQRRIMLMRMTMSEGEVVVALKINAGTAASRYNRARASVRTCIEGKLNGGLS